ncbi:hypothetical protein D6817_04730, partial [Candidatus Pacearchaeota archaeon]
LLTRLKEVRAKIADEQGNIREDVPREVIDRYVRLQKAVETRLKKLNAEFDAAKVNGFIKKTPDGWLATSLYSREQMVFDNMEDAVAFTRGEARVDPKKVNYIQFERAAKRVKEILAGEPAERNVKELASIVEKQLKKEGFHLFIVRRLASAVIRRTKPEQTGREVIFKRAVEPKTEKEKTAANRLAKLNQLRRQAQADYEKAREELLNIILETGNAEFLQAEDVGTYKFQRMEGLDRVPEDIREKVRLALIEHIAQEGVQVLPAVGSYLEIAVTPRVEPKGSPLPKGSVKAKFVEVAKRYERFKKLERAERQLKTSPRIKGIFHNAYLRAFAAGQVYPPIRTEFGAFIVRQGRTNLDLIESLKEKRAQLTREILQREGVQTEKGPDFIKISKIKRVPKEVVPEKATPDQVREIQSAITEVEKEVEQIVNFSIAKVPHKQVLYADGFH